MKVGFPVKYRRTSDSALIVWSVARSQLQPTITASERGQVMTLKLDAFPGTYWSALQHIASKGYALAVEIRHPPGSRAEPLLVAAAGLSPAKIDMNSSFER